MLFSHLMISSKYLYSFSLVVLSFKCIHGLMHFNVEIRNGITGVIRNIVCRGHSSCVMCYLGTSSYKLAKVLSMQISVFVCNLDILIDLFIMLLISSCYRRKKSIIFEKSTFIVEIKFCEGMLQPKMYEVVLEILLFIFKTPSKYKVMSLIKEWFWAPRHLVDLENLLWSYFCYLYNISACYAFK